jgi:hypothetical protein
MLDSATVRSAAVTIAAVVLLQSGCTSLREYARNGFKVGPNHGVPIASVAPQWIDQADSRLRQDPDDLSRWWTVFQDPLLDELIAGAQIHNLSLREAGFRVCRPVLNSGSPTGTCSRNRRICPVSFASGHSGGSGTFRSPSAAKS